VETGALHGVTSRFILEALERNGVGHLWSLEGGAIVVNDIDANRGFQTITQAFSGHRSMICEAEPLRPDLRRFNKKGLFGIILKEPCITRRKLEQIPVTKEVPHRAATTADPSLVHNHDNFIERQVRLPSNQRKQEGRERFQRRDATPARFRSDASRRLPALHPFECRTGAYVEPVGGLPT
jgi:hypothetical protein